MGTLVGLAAAVLLTGLFRSWGAAGSVVLAGIVVVGALTAGLVAVRWLLRQHEAVVLPGAFMILLVVVVLLASVALVLRGEPWLERGPFALSALLSAVLYQVFLVQVYLTGRQPALDVSLPGEGGAR
ncbi:hypothetical protein SGUI_1256 [Serinicoccus hydrothermalis]|uniref:Uncharacterized protein n=1 Tax=Serinicoccus hydrothermalis TaxID=1758689 RepID=A0A1B1NB51_9MICO|nr:hypothetical protein SGUI_1256 [Serinicoccus hydrothermalis]